MWCHTRPLPLIPTPSARAYTLPIAHETRGIDEMPVSEFGKLGVAPL